MPRSKKTPAKPNPKQTEQSDQAKVSFYPAWCKRCGNCEAFCPRDALARDEWGYPFLADPERCTSCGLCEMLCPDFAISVGEGDPASAQMSRKPAASPQDKGAAGSSPERVAPPGKAAKKAAPTQKAKPQKK